VTDAPPVEQESPPDESLFGFDLPTNDNSPLLLKTRHSTAHVMAMAVQKLFPEIKVTIGPWIENGFYYDFFTADREKPLSDSDLKAVKKEMDAIIKANYPITREEVTREEAR
jgi:threonyl-tRNA synthetase